MTPGMFAPCVCSLREEPILCAELPSHYPSKLPWLSSNTPRFPSDLPPNVSKLPSHCEVGLVSTWVSESEFSPISEARFFCAPTTDCYLLLFCVVLLFQKPLHGSGVCHIRRLGRNRRPSQCFLGFYTSRHHADGLFLQAEYARTRITRLGEVTIQYSLKTGLAWFISPTLRSNGRHFFQRSTLASNGALPLGVVKLGNRDNGESRCC
ncbi:hypothetical protein LX36DRAFT_288261 [Colletotrichum falcatum]|nr:hypothetical protein LX36DRAFT_288261 [Colletotrichum falcatum]